MVEISVCEFIALVAVLITLALRTRDGPAASSSQTTLFSRFHA